MNLPISTLFPLTRLVNVWAKPYGVSIKEVIQQGTDDRASLGTHDSTIRTNPLSHFPPLSTPSFLPAVNGLSEWVGVFGRYAT